jgi:hypothetical protein
MNIRTDAVSIGNGASITSAPFVPAVRLGRIWQVRLGERPRTWTIEPGGDVDRADALANRRHVLAERYGRAAVPEEDALDARAFIAVVRLPDGRPVASLRVLGPDDRPLEIEQKLQVDALLPADSRPGEMNRFCILPECRRMGTGIHMALFQWAFALARRQRFSHYLVLAPADVKPIYQFLLFDPVPGVTFEHPRVANVICTPMLLDLRDIAGRYRDARHSFTRLLEVQDALAPELRAS